MHRRTCSVHIQDYGSSEAGPILRQIHSGSTIAFLSMVNSEKAFTVTLDMFYKELKVEGHISGGTAPAQFCVKRRKR